MEGEIRKLKKRMRFSGFLSLVFFLAAGYGMFAEYPFFGAPLVFLILFAGFSVHTGTLKSRRKALEAQARGEVIYEAEEESSGISIGSILFRATIGLIFLPIKLIWRMLFGPKKETEAQRWLRARQAEDAQATAVYQAKKRQRDDMVDEARSLRRQAANASGWQKKNLLDRASKLEREAGWL